MLAMLQQPKDSLRYRIALEDYLPWDLFDEESALLPDALDLQAKLIEVAYEEKAVHKQVSEWVQGSPVSKLFLAIIEQALKDNVAQVRIEFSLDEKPALVWHPGTAAREPALSVPYTLSQALKGATLRAERGYEGLRYLAGDSRELPSGIDVHWESPDVVTISLL